jgi:release factor glutamine methyltransferase
MGSEDTFILLDALEQDAEQLKSMRPRISLEIGSVQLHSSETGIRRVHVGRVPAVYRVFWAALLVHLCVRSPRLLHHLADSRVEVYLCTDINPHACKCSTATGRQNKACTSSTHRRVVG